MNDPRRDEFGEIFLVLSLYLQILFHLISTTFIFQKKEIEVK